MSDFRGSHPRNFVFYKKFVLFIEAKVLFFPKAILVLYCSMLVIFFPFCVVDILI